MNDTKRSIMIEILILIIITIGIISLLSPWLEIIIRGMNFEAFQDNDFLLITRYFFDGDYFIVEEFKDTGLMFENLWNMNFNVYMDLIKILYFIVILTFSIWHLPRKRTYRTGIWLIYLLLFLFLNILYYLFFTLNFNPALEELDAIFSESLNYEIFQYVSPSIGYYLSFTIIILMIIDYIYNNFNLVDFLHQDISLDIEDTFIDIDFKEYDLPEYNEIRDIINLSASEIKSIKSIPILLRTLFENLLREIYNISISKEQRDFIYYKSRLRNFSELIILFNILRNDFFKKYYATEIPQKIIDLLDKIRDEGNYDVHQIIRYIDENHLDNIKDSIKITMNNLLILYRRILHSSNKNIKIDDKDILKKIKEKIQNVDSINL